HLFTEFQYPAIPTAALWAQPTCPPAPARPRLRALWPDIQDDATARLVPPDRGDPAHQSRSPTGSRHQSALPPDRWCRMRSHRNRDSTHTLTALTPPIVKY